MDGTGDRCYENFGRNFTFCGFMMFGTPSVLPNEAQKEFPEKCRVAGADSGAVGGEDEQAAVHPVVDGLAADLEVAGEFGLLHLGMEFSGAAQTGYVFCCDAYFPDGYVHEVVEGYVVVALVGERLEERQEPVGVEGGVAVGDGHTPEQGEGALSRERMYEFVHEHRKPYRL